MRKNRLLPVLLMTAAAVVSCVNNDYDLSDIDTTIGIKVKDLSVAINLEEIKLDKMIDLDDDSQIKKMVDPASGKTIYAVLEEGTFNSSKISISGFSADAPDIKEIADELPLKYINTEVRTALDKEIDKATDAEIDKRKASLVTEYQNQYNQTKDKLVAEAIAKAQAQVPFPLTDEQKKQIEDQVVAGMEKELGYTYDDIETKVSQEVEAQRETIKKETRENPTVRKQAQEIAWGLVEDDEVFAKYDISNSRTSFSAKSDNVDKTLRSLSHITANTEISVTLKLTNLSNILLITVKDTKLQLPKGLELTVDDKTQNKDQVKYDPKTGILDLGDVTLKNGQYFMKLNISGINVAEAGVTFNAKENAPGSFEFSNELGVISGEVNITKQSFINSKTIFDLPDEASYICTPEMTDIKIQAVSGVIQYDIEEPKIDPVNITDLPDVLTDEETSIFLGNPQIYLSVNNPLAEDKLYPQMGLRIDAIRDNAPKVSCSLDKGIIKLDQTTKNSDKNVFCLSPEKPGKYYEGYEKAQHESFKGIASILAGKGIPKRLEITVEHPQLATTEVHDFQLGRDLAAVEGNYTFYAPLTLAENSLIVYRDTVDGWNEDLENILIEKVALDAKVVSTLPLGATLTVKPIDKNGNELKNVETTSLEIKAQSTEQNVSFTIKSATGLKGLDGIILRATVVGNGKTDALSPDNSITIKTAKVTVSGQYVEYDED